MTSRQLRRSLTLWQRRLTYRQRRLRAARRANVKPRIEKWKLLVAEAERMIDRRTRQIREARPVRERAFTIAESLVGIMEHGGNNVGPRVSALIREAGGSPGEPWCGDFVTVCYRQAGSKLVDRSWAAVRLMLTAGVSRTSDPQRGDIVRFRFDHTGLFDCWCDHNGVRASKQAATHLRTIEGNTGATGAVSDGNGSDGVYRKVRDRSLVSDFLHVTK